MAQKVMTVLNSVTIQSSTLLVVLCFKTLCELKTLTAQNTSIDCWSAQPHAHCPTQCRE